MVFMELRRGKIETRKSVQWGREGTGVKCVNSKIKKKNRIAGKYFKSAQFRFQIYT
jgi:hypothetical protein